MMVVETVLEIYPPIYIRRVFAMGNIYLFSMIGN